jgi:hypothetical protein
MAVLADQRMAPEDHLLDIGCGALRLGHLAVPFLRPGHYWGTDASLALMRHGRLHELADPTHLPLENLVEDTDFDFPGIPATITLAIAWGVFTHLPSPALAPALATLHDRFPGLRAALVTLFLADAPGAHRQPDGVVTHPDRPPYHRRRAEVEAEARLAGFTPAWSDRKLPRGQTLLVLARVIP